MKKIFILFVIISSFFGFKLINNESNDVENVETLSTGATGGHLVNKPFDLSVRQSSYISSTGFLYAAGYNNKFEFGNGSNSIVSTHFRLYKEGIEEDVFKNPKSWGFTWYSTVIVDEDGSVWTAGTNEGLRLGLGLTSTSAIQKSFVKVPSIGTENYKAKSTSPGYFHPVVLLEDDTLWAAGGGTYYGYSGNQSTFVQIQLPDVNDKIVDYSGGYSSTYVLYENGDLYRISGTTYSCFKVASNIKFFDVDGSANHGYAVTNDNNILFGKENSNTLWEEVKDEINGEVVQVRGGGIGNGSSWGYLNKAGDLYVAAEKSDGQGELEKIDETNIRFFDMGSSYDANVTTYGYLNQYSQLYLWGSNTEGQLATGSTSSGLNDPNHSESSLVIPSLSADFTGLYSIAPNIKRSVNDEILDPDYLYMNWREEGYLYVDYSNFEFDSSKQQKIEVTISDEYGMLDSFTLDKNNKSNKNANYPKKPGLYTVTSQLLENELGSWELIGSVNTTIFEMGIDENFEIDYDQDIINGYINLIKLHSSRNVVSEIIDSVATSILKSAKTSEQMYVYSDGKVVEYELTASDFSYRILRRTTSSTGDYSNVTTLSSLSSSYNYYVEITFNGVEGYYNSSVYINQFTLESRTLYSGANATLSYYNSGDVIASSTSLSFLNSNNEYFVNLINLVYTENFYYMIEIKNRYSTDETYYSYFKYNDDAWSDMPKEVGSYTIYVYMFEETEYGLIIYPLSSSKNITITKITGPTVVAVDQEAIASSFSSVGASTGGNAIDSLIKSLDGKLNDVITLSSDIYDVSNNMFSNYKYTTDLFTFKFYNSSNSSISSITTGGDYSVRISFNGNKNYNATTTYVTVTFSLTSVVGLLDDSVVFDNNTSTMIYYTGEKYGIDINGYSSELDESKYTIDLLITDDYNFSSSFNYKTTTDTWDYMPKRVGVYFVVVKITDVETNIVSESYSTLNIIEDENVELQVSEEFDNVLTEFLTKDDLNIIDDIVSLIDIKYLTISTDLYDVTRSDGFDKISENVVVTTLSNYTFKIYNSNNIEVININEKGNYYLLISFDGLNGAYDELGNDTKFNFEVLERITLNNIEVGKNVGATSYFTDEDNFYISKIDYFNNGDKYNFVIDAVDSLSTYFDDSYTIKVTMTSDNDKYEFTYINPKLGVISFDDIPKKSGVYNVELTLINNFDDYISIRNVDTLTITSPIISLDLSENVDILLEENKESFKSYIDDLLLNKVDILMYGQILSTLCVVDSNKFVDNDVIDVLEVTYYRLIDSKYTIVDDVIEYGEYKAVISIKDSFDSFSYEPITVSFTITKMPVNVFLIISMSLSMLLVIGGFIIIKKKFM